MLESIREYHPRSSDDRVSDVVIEAVAAVRDEDPTLLDPPLYEAVEPDALDHIFEAWARDPSVPDGQVAFTMANCRVVVHSTGTVTVIPLSGDASRIERRRFWATSGRDDDEKRPPSGREGERPASNTSGVGDSNDGATCAHCGVRIETREWHPVTSVSDDGETVRIVPFCSLDCRREWVRETAGGSRDGSSA